MENSLLVIFDKIPCTIIVQGLWGRFKHRCIPASDLHLIQEFEHQLVLYIVKVKSLECLPLAL